MTRVVAFIPARGGSERVHRKNLRDVGGLSLVARAIHCARAAGIERVVVSTDDLEIAGVALWAAVEFVMRSPAASSSTAQIEDAIAEWWDALADRDRPDVVVLLQPTSPFRRPETIRRCVDLALSSSHAFTVTRTHPAEFHGMIDTRPDGTRRIWRDYHDERPRTQDCADYGYENGSVYAFTRAHWERHGERLAHSHGAVVETDAIEALDIDTERDLEIAQRLAEAGAPW